MQLLCACRCCRHAGIHLKTMHSSIAHPFKQPSGPCKRMGVRAHICVDVLRAVLVQLLDDDAKGPPGQLFVRIVLLVVLVIVLIIVLVILSSNGGSTSAAAYASGLHRSPPPQARMHSGAQCCQSAEA